MDYYYITGASRGLGRALADELLQDQETTVIGLARGEGPTHKRYRHVTLNLMDVSAVSDFRFEEHADARRFVLVNNAASLIINRIGDAEPQTIVDTLGINILSPAILMNAFISAYRPTGAEMLICNLTSPAAQQPIEGAALYGGAKSALELVTRTIVEEAAVTNAPQIKAFCINPGAVDTSMQSYLRTLDVAVWSRAEVFRRLHENGRLRSPADVAAGISRALRNPTLAPGPVFDWTDIPLAP